MPSSDNHEAHDYAERIRERLPRRLQELYEAARLSMYALWQKCGVSRDTISRIEGGDSIPTFHVGTRLIYGVDKTKSKDKTTTQVVSATKQTGSTTTL